MTLRVAIQMDPIGAIDIRGDTSFALGLAAQVALVAAEEALGRTYDG